MNKSTFNKLTECISNKFEDSGLYFKYYICQYRDEKKTNDALCKLFAKTNVKVEFVMGSNYSGDPIQKCMELTFPNYKTVTVFPNYYIIYNPTTQYINVTNYIKTFINSICIYDDVSRRLFSIFDEDYTYSTNPSLYLTKYDNKKVDMSDVRSMILYDGSVESALTVWEILHSFKDKFIITTANDATNSYILFDLVGTAEDYAEHIVIRPGDCIVIDYNTDKLSVLQDFEQMYLKHLKFDMIGDDWISFTKDYLKLIEKRPHLYYGFDCDNKVCDEFCFTMFKYMDDEQFRTFIETGKSFQEQHFYSDSFKETEKSVGKYVKYRPGTEWMKFDKHMFMYLADEEDIYKLFEIYIPAEFTTIGILSYFRLSNEYNKKIISEDDEADKLNECTIIFPADYKAPELHYCSVAKVKADSVKSDKQRFVSIKFDGYNIEQIKEYVTKYGGHAGFIQTYLDDYDSDNHKYPRIYIVNKFGEATLTLYADNSYVIIDTLAKQPLLGLMDYQYKVFYKELDVVK